MIPVRVEERDGRFLVSAFGSIDLRAEGPTKGEAIASLQAILEARAGEGVVWIAGPLPGAGPTWPPREYDPERAAISRKIVRKIYRERDAQRAREFPE